MRAPLSKCESPSYFFKFIKPGLRKYLKSRRNNTTAILKRGSQKWFVKIIDCAFSEGWDDFVKENGVQDFDFVVFKHEGNMVFNTMVFDNTQSWCQREFSNNQVTKSRRKCKINTNALKKIPKEKDAIPDNNHHAYFLGTLKSADWKYRLFFPINFTRSNGLRNGEMILRNGQNQMSWTVDFKICLGSCPRIGRGWHDFYTANGLKYIPRKFALKNGLKGGELVLKNVENEGSWTVNLSNPLGRSCRIRGGLKGFCTANSLEKGDHVKFELIQNGKKPIAIISKNEDASEQSTVLR
ncbi:hypothetical protein L1987_09988 [Smallanthus sonchifolius]|uniref:Uncharacterized protein n=1 Tax=Smallanthus sonchifolius TaxID=185202 RepID=A0ACB9JQV1_9ASTR|nr:hypothetical protein L1987_09988 [Smallanthus sonchifolius]